MVYTKKYRDMLTKSVAIVGLFSVLLGCNQSSTSPEEKISSNDKKTDVKLENCLILVLDTAASSHMDYTGYFRETTPNIDQIVAKNGVLFTNAHSQSSTTVSSTWSYMTSQYCQGPADTLLGYEVRDWDYTFADAFQDAGFITGGFSENPYITPSLDYDHGFDNFYVYSSLLPPEDPEVKYRKRDHAGTLGLMQNAVHWIQGKKEEQWMAYLHILRPHNPFDAPSPLGTQFTKEPIRHMNEENRSEKNMYVRWMYYMVSPNDEDMEYYAAAYDGNFLYMDALVQDFIATLNKTNSLDDTLIVIMSDHGEGFLEHNRLGHNTTVYEEMVHVPLAFVFPEGANIEPKNIDGLAELVDLFPTLADAFDLKHPEETHGISLWPAITGQKKNTGRTTSISMINEATNFYIREGDIKLVVWLQGDRKTIKTAELYDLAKDPYEKHDLFTDWKSLGPLAHKANEHIAQFASQQFEAMEREHDSDIIDDLRALGYLEGKDDEEDDDEKKKEPPIN